MGNNPQLPVPAPREIPLSPSLLTEAQIAFLQSLHRPPMPNSCHLSFSLAPCSSSQIPQPPLFKGGRDYFMIASKIPTIPLERSYVSSTSSLSFQRRKPLPSIR